MTTKSELIELVSTDRDTAAADMATAAEAFRTAYRIAHANDFVARIIGGQEVGQNIDKDHLNTMNTPAHASYRDAHVPLFDGRAEQPDIEAAAATIMADLQTQYPEVFA